MPHWTDYLDQEKPKEKHWTDFFGKEWETIKSIPEGMIVAPIRDVVYPMGRGVVETIASGMKPGTGTERIEKAGEKGKEMILGTLKSILPVAMAGTKPIGQPNPVADYLLNKQIEEQGILGGVVIPAAMLAGAVKGGVKLAEGGRVAPTIKKLKPEAPPAVEQIKPEIKPEVSPSVAEQPKTVPPTGVKAEIPPEVQGLGREILAKGGKPSWRDWFELQAKSRNEQDFVKWGEAHNHFTNPEVINQLRESGIEFKTPQELYAKLKGEPVVELTEGTKPSRLAVKTEQRAIARGIEADFGDLPAYETMNMEHQAGLADNLLKTNPEMAKSVAMGEALPEGELRAGSVYKALEIQALHNNDVNTILDLSKSNLATKYSALGQEIKALDVGDPESPVRAIRQIAKTREEMAQVRTRGIRIDKVKEGIAEEVRIEIKRGLTKTQTWEEFVNSIRC